MKRTSISAISVAALAAATLTVPALAAQDGSTIRYTTTKGQSAEIPLGEAFADNVVRNGEKIGLSTGTATVVYVTDERLVVTISGTVILPGGTLTYAGVNDENPAEGLGTVTFAVTGGTGRYRGANGEGTARFLPGTDTAQVVIRLE